VRLISEDGSQVGVVPTEQALEMAREASMDLVEVSPDARPPVCKIMDYGKYKYRQKKRQHQRKVHVSQLKEIWARPKTDVHDLKIKVEHARKFIENKDKVQVSVRFRGREMSHQELGLRIMDHFKAELGDLVKVEQEPRAAGRRMTMVLTPR
jgi:translation initiation factor IF-3